MLENDKTVVDSTEETTATHKSESEVKTSSANKAASKEAGAASADVSFEESFAAQIDKTMVRLHNNQVTVGTVISVTEDEIMVNLGYKADGCIKRAEFCSDPDVVLTQAVTVGQEIKVEVIKVHDESGNVALSCRSIEEQVKLEKLRDNGEIVGQEFDVTIKKAVKRGLTTTIGRNMRVFIPVSQVSLGKTPSDEDLIKYERRHYKIRIVRVDEEKNSLIGSIKEVRLKELCAAFKPNTTVTGTVGAYNAKLGYFISLGEMDGLIHFKDLSWVQQDSYEGMFKEGQEIQVMILDVDTEKCRISLGYKQLQPRPNPWDVHIDKFHEGDTVTGKVIKIMEYGAQVRLFHGLSGFVHISEIAHRRVNKVEDELRVDQEVRCKILSIEPEKHRINLSIKAQLLEDDPELAARVAHEKEERERRKAEYAERDAQRAAADQQRKERQARFEAARAEGASAAPAGEQQPRQRRERTDDSFRQDRGERRPRHNDDGDYELPPVEQATTSLSGLFSGLTGSDDENK